MRDLQLGGDQEAHRCRSQTLRSSEIGEIADHFGAPGRVNTRLEFGSVVSDIAITGFVAVTATRETAFAAFYQQNIGSLSRTLTAALGDPQVAQDAAQEAMARACERWEKIESYDNPVGWCYRVAMNWATSRWRKRKREVITDRLPTPDPAVLPDIELQDRLALALRSLSVDHRSVIVLRLVEDWSINETAEALGIAPGTVQSRYARALTRLREELGDIHE